MKIKSSVKLSLKLLTILALVAGLCLLGCEGPTGPNGPNGDDGKNGTNSSEKGDPGDKGPDGEQGEKGEKGDAYEGDATALNGHDGPKGFDGASVIIMGVIATEDDLPYPGGLTVGVTEAYIVGGILYVWDITNADWINTGQPVQGERGPQGSKGPTGKDGPVGGDPVTVYEVKFIADDDTEAEATFTVLEGGKIKPAVYAKTLEKTPVNAVGLYRPDYNFIGWYELIPPAEEGDDPTLATEPWDLNQPFDRDVTLKGCWEAPVLLAPGMSVVVTGENPTAISTANYMQQAFAYLNEATAASAWKAGSYVLYLHQDYNAGYTYTQGGYFGGNLVLNVDVDYYSGGKGRHLKIAALPDEQGNDVERKIVLAYKDNSLLGVGSKYADNAFTATLQSQDYNSITLGKNITLVGAADGTSALVLVRTGGRFIMEEGSKITGHTNSYASGTVNASSTYQRGYTAGVDVDGGIFIMKGGEISGLTKTGISNATAGIAVYVSSPNTNHIGRFIMEGGEIKGNTGEGLADVYIAENTYNTSVAPLTLSGEAKPGVVALNRTSTVDNRAIAIASGWDGEIAGIDLRSGGIVAITDVLPMWYNDATPAASPLIVTGAGGYTLGAGDIAKITLRNFVDNLAVPLDVHTETITESTNIGFRDDYELDITGKLKIKD